MSTALFGTKIFMHTNLQCVSSFSPSALLPLYVYFTFCILSADAKATATLNVRKIPDWGVVLEQLPDAILTNGLARAIFHQVDVIPKAEPMSDEHNCDVTQKRKYDAVFRAANTRFIASVRQELNQFMGSMDGDGFSTPPQTQKATWKERILEDFMLCDAQQIRCKFFPVMQPEKLTESHEIGEYDYSFVPCNADGVGGYSGCPKTHDKNPSICCARSFELNRKKCPTESMLHSLDLVRSWHNSNLDDVIPFGPTAWDINKETQKTSFSLEKANYHSVHTAQAYCIGLTDIYTPEGSQRIGDTLVIPAQGFQDFNGRPSIRIHLSSKWHGQSANVDVFSHEKPHRKRRELLPLVPAEGSWEKLVSPDASGDWDTEFPDDEDFMSNEYETSSQTTRTRSLDTYEPPEDIDPVFEDETLPLAPPIASHTTALPMAPIGGSLPTERPDIWGKINNFWTDNKETEAKRITPRIITPTPQITTSTTPKQQISHSFAEPTMTPTIAQTLNSQRPTIIKQTLAPREINPPKYLESAGQPRKSRAKSRTRRGWFSFISKLGFLGLSPRYTDDLVSNLQKIEDIKIDNLGKAMAANTAGLMKVQTLGTKIKTIREDFCQTSLEIVEDSIVERLEMRLDDMLASVVSHMEWCNQGVTPLTIPESHLVKICKSLTDSNICSSTAVRSLFTCKIDGLNIVKGKVITGYDVQFQIPISDRYRISQVTVLPLFTQNTKTINLPVQKVKETQPEQPNSLEKLGLAIKEVLEAQRRSRRSTDPQPKTLNLHRIHKVADAPYVVIESKENEYSYGILKREDCTSLPNGIMMCQWVQAESLSNCWENILNNKHAEASKTCRGSTETTERTCFVEKLTSGYAISSLAPLSIVNEELGQQKNRILKTKESKICEKLCILEMQDTRRTITCDQKQITTDILEEYTVKVEAITDDEVSVDLSNLRPLAEEDGELEIGVSAIDNFISQRLKPAKVKSQLKFMTIITATVTGALLLALAAYCTWKWVTKLIPFPMHKPKWSMPRPRYEETRYADETQYDTSEYLQQYLVKPRSRKKKITP